MSLLRTRSESIYLSSEVRWYLTMLVKAQIAGTDASRTIDEYCDAYLRYKIATDYPDLVIAYEKFTEAKQKNKKAYEAIEERVIESINASPAIEIEKSEENRQ